MFLTVGGKEEQSVNRVYKNKRLETVYGLPTGSSVLCNESAYMDDETWLEVCRVIGPAIRCMPFIRDHPDWWVCMSYNGFKSHLNVDTALDVLYSYRICVVKEEAGTSHINQGS